MRCLAAIVLIGLTLGCSATRHKNAPPAPVAQRSAPAAALAFDGPVNGTLPEYALDRPSRDPVAYVGYDLSIVIYSYTRTDDRQYLFDQFNDYDRQAYSTRIGVSYR